MGLTDILLSYYGDVPYHNTRHALDVRDRAVSLASQIAGLDCGQAEIAALGHDVCIGARLPSGQTQEQFSSSVVGRVLDNYGFARGYTDAVVTAIVETSPHAVPKTALGKILRAADLAIFAEQCYRDGFARMMREANASSERDFLLDIERTLASSLFQSIRLTNRYWGERGESAWHEGVLSNIVAHHRELFPDDPVIVEIGPGANPLVLYEHTGGLVIGVEPGCWEREAAVTLMRASHSPIELIVPGTGRALPVVFRPDVMYFVNTALRCPEAFDCDAIRFADPLAVLVRETYSPSDGFAGSVSEAIDHICTRIAPAGYSLALISSPAGPGRPAPDAFEASFKKSWGGG